MNERKRYTLLDIIRTVAIINMVFYHAMWDVTRIFGVEAAWFSSDGAAVSAEKYPSDFYSRIGILYVFFKII